ncbi:sensor histidine kinase [Nonomuraea guangzhouensis]|uniref:histidine kinase n=1 Tax=Nonomuraea guangzhouensis TaxID=1291555 RepID=A0ABW4GLL3_9ACTN|nr:sensor domain-containing protein [Nonomuraea guangzhouensis]
MTKLRQLLEPAAGLLLNAATGVAAWLLFALLAGCVMLIPVGGLGFPLLAHALVAVRALTRFQRAWAARVLGYEITGPDRRSRRGRTRRDLTWLAVHALVGPSCVITIGTLLSFVGVILNLHPLENSRWQTITLSLTILTFVAIAVAAIPLMNRAQARLAELLLRPASSLTQRVWELTESRAAAVDAQAAELRRIERDLHDGAQARLISVRMSLGLIKGANDPDQVRALVQEAWESAGQALVDLRDLVRGIHPPVLADRGLAGAIQAAALLCPIPVEVDIDLPARPEAPVESAVYFAAVEALTNVTKHSRAARAWVRLRHEGGILRLAVGDDGRGGADPAAGTGLDGIRRRLSAFDGTLAISSPPGGPSRLIMELPCALSSPKISHS